MDMHRFLPIRPSRTTACRAIAALFLVLPLSLTAPKSAMSQFANKQIYPDPSAAPEDLQAALAKARREHKRVIVEFGGNWCGDCRVLDIYFEQPPNADLLAKYFIKVGVNVGHFDANVDLAQKFGVPLNRGVPALVVLDSSGKVLYAQKNAEFEKMRQLAPSDLTAFLQHWKP